MYIYIYALYSLTPIPSRRQLSQSEGFTLTGYDIPGCVEDGTWMLRENSSVAIAVVAVVVAHPGLGRGQLSVLLRLRRFRDARIDLSHLPSTDGIRNTESCRRRNLNLRNRRKKHKKRPTRACHKNPLYKSLIKIPHSYPLKGAVMYNFISFV